MNVLLQRYPRAVPGQIILRPMNASDESALISFFKRIPIDERQLFREDVTRLSVIQAWIKNLDYGRILPILAFRGLESVLTPRFIATKAGGRVIWGRAD